MNALTMEISAIREYLDIILKRNKAIHSDIQPAIETSTQVLE